MAKKKTTTGGGRRRSGDDWAPKFLKALAECGVIAYAAKLAGVNRRTVYRRRNSDREFAKELRSTIREANDALVYEVFRRGVKGTVKPVYQGGRHVGDIREYSDSLLIFLCKARMPKVFRDNYRVEHSGDAKNPIPVNHSGSVNYDDGSELTPDVLAAFAADMAAAGLAHLSPDGGEQPVDAVPPAAQNPEAVPGESPRP